MGVSGPRAEALRKGISSKAPNPEQPPSSKLQDWWFQGALGQFASIGPRSIRSFGSSFWPLEFGVSLVLGAWAWNFSAG